MSTTITINTYKELQNFRDNVNNGTNTAKTVKLGADIDMNGDDWTPIGYNDSKTIRLFSGTFDGQGHVISNMKINITSGTDNLYFGLFGYGGSLYINNLILDNPIIYNSNNNFLYDDKKSDYVSFLCGYNNQTTNAITNCRIINGHININNTGKYVSNILIGCVCSFCMTSSAYNITNCYVEVEFNIKGNILPAFGGIAHNNGFISNCGIKITGIIDLNLKSYSKAIIINGLTNLSSTNNLQITNCYVHMDFKFNIYARPIASGYNQIIYGIGYNSYSSYTPTISNCYVISNIELNTSTPGMTYYYTSSNKATATNCYSLINLLLRQYGKYNNTQLVRNKETLQYKIAYANDTQYSNGTISYTGTHTESTTLEDDLQSGKICYLLNGSSSSNVNFYQSLNFDKYPVLDNRHYIVNNPLTDTYTNTSNTNYIYDIWTYDDLMQFKAIVNAIGKTAYENKDPVNLHRDFDLNGEKWYIIHNFYGIFNGNNHKITNFYMDIAEAMLDYTDDNLNDVYALGFFGYAYQVLNLSIEMKMTGTYNKSNTKLYIGVIAAHLVLCQNIKTFIILDDCDIISKNVYISGTACINNKYNSTYRKCNVNMYLRNSTFTIQYGYINGISDSIYAYNCNAILDINDTNILDGDEINVCGISYNNLTTEKCSSYVNFVNNSIIHTLKLSGIGYGTIGGTTTNSYTYVNIKAKIDSFSQLSGMTGYYNSTITNCYCVFRCNITIDDSCINNYIGGLSTSNNSTLNNVYVDQEIMYSISKANTENYIGMIICSNSISETAYCIKNNITQSGANSATLYTSGTEITLDTFKSGQVCYELNNKNQDINNIIFYQSIGSNYYPVFDSNEWKVFYDDSKTPKYYNNIPAFNNTISNYADLITFRNLVNNGNSFETTENNTVTKTTIIIKATSRQRITDRPSRKER